MDANDEPPAVELTIQIEITCLKALCKGKPKGTSKIVIESPQRLKPNLHAYHLPGLHIASIAVAKA
jgi:hypothetical protein